MFLNQFQNVGRSLFNRGLVSSQSGNLSIRMGDRLIITRRGSNLGDLQESDLIETGICKNDRSTPLASIELPVHRASIRIPRLVPLFMLTLLM
jgi:L-fuculose-phosphate aldolase